MGHTASMRKLENYSKCRIRTAGAYSSVHDTEARWPEYNFTECVKYALEHPGKEIFDVLLLYAPTVDITNLDTATLSAIDNTERFQQKAVLSSENMFILAQRSPEQNPKLKKVILMENPPRFDTHERDPTSLKAELARLANATLGQLWLNSNLKDKIFIGRQSLESSGAGAVHLAR